MMRNSSNIVKWCAIAAIYSRNALIGVRLFNIDKLSIIDISMSRIFDMIVNGTKIQNLNIVNNDIEWVSGSIDRYPVIKNGDITDNKNRATVACSYDRLDGKHYRIVDCTGKSAIIPETKVIQLAKTYGLTNCKLVTKNDGKQFIQSISGGIPNSELENSYYIRDNILFMNLPNFSDKTIRLPGMIDGKYISAKIAGVVVNPDYVASSIDELKIPEELGCINNNILRPFKNVKRVVINNRNVVIESNAFINNQDIEEVYIRGVHTICANAFRGCKNLKTVYIHEQCGSVEEKAFANCTSFDVEGFVRQNIKCYGSYVFQNCSATRLNLSDGTTCFSKAAFNNINGLKEIILNANTIRISDRYYSNRALLDYPSIDLVIDNEFSSLDEIQYTIEQDAIYKAKDTNISLDPKDLKSNINIIIRDIKTKEKSIENVKLKLAGMSSSDKLLKTREDITKWFSLVPQEDLTKAVKDAILKSIASTRLYNLIVDVGGKDIYFSGFRMNKSRIKNMYTLDNAIIIDLTKTTLVIFTDKQAMVNMAKYTKYNITGSYGMPYVTYKSEKRLGKIERVWWKPENHSIMYAKLCNGEIHELFIKS